MITLVKGNLCSIWLSDKAILCRFSFRKYEADFAKSENGNIPKPSTFGISQRFTNKNDSGGKKKISHCARLLKIHKRKYATGGCIKFLAKSGVTTRTGRISKTKASLSFPILFTLDYSNMAVKSEGKHEPIISKTFDEAQEMLKFRGQPKNHKTNLNHLRTHFLCFLWNDDNC